MRQRKFTRTDRKAPTTHKQTVLVKVGKEIFTKTSQQGKEVSLYLSDNTKTVMKKIYFAGSIRGGRVDAELYGRLIKYMQKTAVVLTEHVGSPHLNLLEQGKRDIEIYDEDMAWLRESDVIVAECTCPSLGVGYELAYAEAKGKPCHIFYDRTKTQLSAMLTGNPYFHIHPYEKEEDIYPMLDTII